MVESGIKDHNLNPIGHAILGVESVTLEVRIKVRTFVSVTLMVLLGTFLFLFTQSLLYFEYILSVLTINTV
jgi:hypothetical protein